MQTKRSALLYRRFQPPGRSRVSPKNRFSLSVTQWLPTRPWIVGADAKPLPAQHVASAIFPRSGVNAHAKSAYGRRPCYKTSLFPSGLVCDLLNRALHPSVCYTDPDRPLRTWESLILTVNTD